MHQRVTMSGNTDKSLVLSAFSHIGAQREHTSVFPVPYVMCIDITRFFKLGSVMLTKMLTFTWIPDTSTRNVTVVHTGAHFFLPSIGASAPSAVCAGD